MYTRRDFGKVALAALPAAQSLARPNSNFGGVQIGIIAPYSFRGMPGDADSLLDNIVALGLSAVEMQSPPVEAFASTWPSAGRCGTGWSRRGTSARQGPPGVDAGGASRAARRG